MLIRIKDERYILEPTKEFNQLNVRDTLEDKIVTEFNNWGIQEAQRYVAVLNQNWIKHTLESIKHYEVVTVISSEEAKVSYATTNCGCCAECAKEENCAKACNNTCADCSFKPKTELAELVENSESEEGLEWSCEICNSEWVGGYFETYTNCPMCKSGHVSHY